MTSHDVLTLAGQAATISRPTRRSTNRLVVIAHGADNTYEYATGGSSAYGNLQEMIDYLCQRGYVVVCAAIQDTSLTPAANVGKTWGNNVSTTQLDSVITAAKAQYGVSQGKFGLLSVSMGAMTIANWVRRFGQTNLAGMLSFLPGCILSSYRGTTAVPNGGFADINTAYSSLGSPTDALFTTPTTGVYAIYEPSVIAPTVTVPWGFWTNSDDAFAPPALSDTVAPLVPNGKGTRVNMGVSDGTNSGHNFSRIAGKDVHAFLDSWSW